MYVDIFLHTHIVGKYKHMICLVVELFMYDGQSIVLLICVYMVFALVTAIRLDKWPWWSPTIWIYIRTANAHAPSLPPHNPPSASSLYRKPHCAMGQHTQTLISYEWSADLSSPATTKIGFSCDRSRATTVKTFIEVLYTIVTRAI